MVYQEISCESLAFSWYTNELLGEYVYEENTSDLWDIPWTISPRGHCVTILIHSIENTVANTINATYVQGNHDRKVGCTCNTIECTTIFLYF